MMRMTIKTNCPKIDQAQKAHNVAVSRLISKFKIEQPLFEVKRKEQMKDISASLKTLVIDDIEFIKNVWDTKPTELVVSVDDAEI